MTLTPPQQAFEFALQNWAAQRKANEDTRDDLVIGAIDAGLSKHRVHVLTGIARTTIDDILGRAQTGTKEQDR